MDAEFVETLKSCTVEELVVKAEIWGYLLHNAKFEKEKGWLSGDKKAKEAAEDMIKEIKGYIEAIREEARKR